MLCSALLRVGKVSAQEKNLAGIPAFRESSAQPKAQEDPGGTSADTSGSKRYQHQEQGSKAHLMDGKTHS